MKIYQSLRTQWQGMSLLIIAAAIICICTSSKPANYVVDFSGEWKLNEGKSELGQFGRGAASVIKVVSSDANGISLERTSTNRNGEAVVRKEALTFDGKEVESAGGFGNSKRKSTAKWSDDGQSMVISSTTSFERDGQTMETKQKETWKLADGGKTLMIESNSTSSFGDNTMKLVYDKVAKTF